MSHFITLVFTKENGRTVDELLAPYDENIEYAPYVRYTKEQAIAEVRQEIEEYKNGLYAKYLENPEEYERKCHNEAHLDYLKNQFPQKLNWTDEECYKEMTKFYGEDMIKPNGDILSTYNPNAKYDWYVQGGRWDRYLPTLHGETVNEAAVNEIDWEKIEAPFAFITPIGEWYEQGEMLYFAIVAHEKEKSDWETEFKEFVKSLKDKDNIYVTVVDCHI